MTTVFEVDTIFRITNRASPTLTAILRQVRELNVAIEKTRLNLAEIGKGGAIGSTSLTSAIGETKLLAAEWGNVARNAGAAQRAIGSASMATMRTGAANAVAGGGGGRHQPGWLRSHFGGPSAPLPGGGHLRFGGGAAAAAGLLGYGAYEAAQMEDAVWQLIYHSGQEQNETNRARFRKMLQDAMTESGYGLKDISEAAKQEIRMFQGTPGGGIGVLPEMLRAATIESRLKGSSPDESMRALVGLAHMTKQYDPEAIKKLAPAFAFLSTANPGSLSSIERAAGYAVPILQSGLEVDPVESLLLGTALTRAGATSTKSGTWLREMALRAMPGTTPLTRFMHNKHEAALRALGLVDDHGKPTWFSDGRPDISKMLQIAGKNAPRIPLTERAGLERQLFGAQGAGAFALLTDPAVNDQVKRLREEMNSQEFKNRYGAFTQSYAQGSTVQQARTSLAEFNITMMDLGQHVLPGANLALGKFKNILEAIRGVIPGGSKGEAGVVAGAFGGSAVGGAVGALGGPGGIAGGAAVGGVIGGILGIQGNSIDRGGSYTSPGKTGRPARPKDEGAAIGAAGGGVLGVAEQYMQSIDRPIDRFSRSVVVTGNSAAQAAEGMKSLGDAIKGLMPNVPPGGVFPGGSSPAPKAAPISFSLNIDGRSLAKAMIDKIDAVYRYQTNTPAFNGANTTES
jgi:hypothetical protein